INLFHFARAIDFTLHTIVEESCEESDGERSKHPRDNPNRHSGPTELEKYFTELVGRESPKRFANEESEYSDTFSESSGSVFSEGVDWKGGEGVEGVDRAELASSRLEKSFMSGFMGFDYCPPIQQQSRPGHKLQGSAAAADVADELSDPQSDGSGSV